MSLDTISQLYFSFIILEISYLGLLSIKTSGGEGSEQLRKVLSIAGLNMDT